MISSNLDLVTGFPAPLRDDVLAVISALPETELSSQTFSVDIGSEAVAIPYRIYHDPTSVHSKSLTRTQNELLACLLTRHHNGFIREENLDRILDSNHEWVPPFVVQLLGEYVIEIIEAIRDNIYRLDSNAYGAFLTRNPLFYRTTKDRVASYWNCYYRHQQKKDYAGFHVIEALNRLI
jgi:hypothetical protein